MFKPKQTRSATNNAKRKVIIDDDENGEDEDFWWYVLEKVFVIFDLKQIDLKLSFLWFVMLSILCNIFWGN